MTGINSYQKISLGCLEINLGSSSFPVTLYALILSLLQIEPKEGSFVCISSINARSVACSIIKLLPLNPIGPEQTQNCKGIPASSQDRFGTFWKRVTARDSLAFHWRVEFNSVIKTILRLFES